MEVVTDWLKRNGLLVGVVSGVMFLGTLWAIQVLIVRMDSKYFLYPVGQSTWSRRHPALRAAIRVGKNLLGLVLLAAGVAMLVLPGQGLLTVLIGLTLLEFPGKRRFEMWIVRKPPVIKSINWMRAKSDRPPLELPH